jgi:hypothetical protein
MEADRYARYGAATGIIGVLLIFVGFAIYGTDVPDASASAQEWGSFFRDHQDRIQTSMVLLSLGTFFFLWFLGSVRSAIAAVEPAGGRLATIAVAGGVIAAVFFIIAISASATAAFRPDEVDPQLTRALNDFGVLAAGPTAAGVAALFGAMAIAGYRLGAFPAPVAGLAALAAIVQVFAMLTVTTDTGALAPDGWLGLWVPFVPILLAIVAASVSLMRRPSGLAGPAAAQ